MIIETKNRKTLADIASADGVFAIIAMDQRNTLRRMFEAVGIEASEEDLRTAKADVARALTPAASGMLLDPTFGVPAVTETQALAPGCGLLVAAEPSSRDSYNGEPRTRRDPELNARWVSKQGGDAVKFLVQLRADRFVAKPAEPDLAAEVLDVCQQIVTDCASEGLPSVI
jgi:tagatose-1,6-bisphosphate aldolase